MRIYPFRMGLTRLWTVFFILLHLGGIADAALKEIDAENSQTANICSLLSNASLTNVTVTNCLDDPVKLLMVSQMLIKVTTGVPQRIVAPDGWDLISWNTLDERGFPIIQSQAKCLRLLSFAEKPAAVYALKTVTLGSKEQQTLTAPPHFTISHLTNESDEKTFVNIDTFDKNLSLSLQPTPRSFWSSMAKDYDFSTLAFQGDVVWPFLEEFRDKILSRANIVPKAFYKMIGESYLDYLKLMQGESQQKRPRIPLTIHTIWLSDKENPTEPKPEYSTWLAETMQVCPPKEGWKYILWINCQDMAIAKHPLTGVADTLEPFVEVRHVNTLPQDTEWFRIFELMLLQKNYGAASDVLRLIILKRLGGVYRDTDFKFIQSPLVLNNMLDFYSGMEGPQPIAACNAMIACKPNHPIIDCALDLIVQGASLKDCPDYLEPYLSKRVLRTLLHTGPMMLSMAFYQAGGRDDNRDVLFPPEVFFWPAYDKAGPRHKWPVQTAGIHYHKASWL